MSDIFVSYAKEDRARVRPLVDALTRRGWSVWWDRTIPPGKTWEQVIETELETARCVLVLWSRDSVQSHWVKTEADDARQRRILLPAMLDDVKIPLAFRSIQAANLVAWEGDEKNVEFRQLVRAVSELVPESAPTPAASEPTAAAQPAKAREVKPSISAQSGERGARRAGKRVGLWQPAMMIGALVVAAALAWYIIPRSSSGSLSNRPFAPDAASTPASAPPAPGQLRSSPGSSSERPSAPETASTTGNAPLAPGHLRLNPIDGLMYAWIPPGNFLMGCSPGDNECDDDEKPPHTEQIQSGFWLSQTEATQAAWKKVNGHDNNPSHFKGDQLPVENVDWTQAQNYCIAIGGRLPTEKEWEYAARAGTTGACYGALDAVAWYSGNSGSTTHPVGLKEANDFGLYDMLGNVWEWTSTD